MSDSDDDSYDPAAVEVAVKEEPTTERHAPVGSGAPSSSAHLSSSVSATAAATTATTESREEAAHMGELRRRGVRLKGLEGRARCVCVSPSGTLLCAGGEDGKFCMWDFAHPAPEGRIAPTRVLTPFVNRIAGLQPIVCAHFSPSGAYVVACQDGDAPVVVEARGGRQLGYCAMGERGFMDVVKCKGHRAPVTASAAHPTNDELFLTAAQDGTARVWDARVFERGSAYAVKHGSGRLTDTFLVESVAGLRHAGSGGATFATGGTDGYVYVWDSRAKYRPGGHVACWDVFAGGPQPLEKHVGGMLELQSGGAPLLAVRAVDTVSVFDLRRLSAPTATSALPGIGCVLDTAPLAPAAAPGHFLTCTSRAGYPGGRGGRVLRAAVTPDGACSVAESWLCGGDGGAAEAEDVLCACADTSRSDGLVYAGLGCGDVLVHGVSIDGLRAGAAAPNDAEPHALQTWWRESRATRKQRFGNSAGGGAESGGGQANADNRRGGPNPRTAGVPPPRELGKKFARPAEEEEDISDLF